jgi:hypothetical protein
VDACRSVPPTVVGELRNGSTRCGSSRHPTLLPGAKNCQRRPYNPLSPGVHACPCVPPTSAGESEYGSARCGGGRQLAPLPVQTWTLAGARLPPTRASPLMAPHGVAAVGVTRPDVDACRCMPPTNAGESENGSTRCGNDWHPLRPGADTCRCAPPTNTGEFRNGSTRSARRPAPPLFQAWMFAGARVPPSRASPGTTPCGVAAAPPLSVQVRALAGARLPPLRVSPVTASHVVAAADTPLPPSRRERLLVRASHCRRGESGNGSARCGGDRPPPLHRGVATLRHKARVKALPSSCLADDDYILASFTSLKASSKGFCALVW